MSPTELCTKRLKKELRDLQKKPLESIRALPLESNLLEWHYVIEGAKGTPYENGWYHGKVIFPPTYPYKPPSLQMLTPSGRFKTNTRLCLSMSDFHPESWNPMWSVSTILMGLFSFMLEESPTFGSITTSDQMKKNLASESLEYNCKNKIFCELFPELVEKFEEIKKFSQSSEEVSNVNKETSSGALAGDIQLPWAAICAIIAILISSFWALVSYSLR